MISDEDISIYINAGKNSNTVEKTKNDLTRLNNWRKISLKDANPVPIEQIEADELNKLLRSFFLTIKKVNGEDYEPSSLRSMLGSFSRHLQEAKYPIKVMEGNDGPVVFSTIDFSKKYIINRLCHGFPYNMGYIVRYAISDEILVLYSASPRTIQEISSDMA